MAFQMLDDPRGGHAELPPPYYCDEATAAAAAAADSSRSTEFGFEFLHRMNGLRRAYLRHLTVKLSDDVSSPLPSYLKKNSSDPRFANEVQYVALHHFDPRVVRVVAEAAGYGRDIDIATYYNEKSNGRQLQYRVPWTMKASEIQRLGLDVTEEDRVVQPQRRERRMHSHNATATATDEYYFVPNYPMEKAYQDLKRLSRAERSTADITANVYHQAKKAIKAKKKQNQKDSNSKKDGGSKQQDEPKSKGTNKKDKGGEGRKKDGQNKDERRKKSKQTQQVSSSGAGKAIAASMGAFNKNLGPKVDNQVTDFVKGASTANSSVATMDLSTPKIIAVGEVGSDGPQGSITVFEESYALFDKSTTNNIQAWEANNASSTAAIAAPATLQARTTLGASDRTMVGAQNSATSSNLMDSSTVSLRLTDPALHTSDSTFHGSDQTLKASGNDANQNSSGKWNASDTTLAVSNTKATTVGSDTEATVAIDMASTTQQQQKWSASLPRLESGRVLQMDLSPKRKSVMGTSENVASSVAEEVLLKALPCQSTNGVPMNETANEGSKVSTSPRSHGTSANKNQISPPSLKILLTQSEIKETTDEVKAADTLSNANDASPLAQKSTCKDFSPRSPERMVSVRSIGDQSSYTESMEDMSPVNVKEMQSVHDKHVSANDCRAEDTGRGEHSTRSSSGSKGRRSSADMIAFLDARERKSRGDLSVRSRSGSSTFSDGLPLLTGSEESGERQRRRSHFVPRPSKSDSSSGSARRISNTYLPSRLSQTDTIKDSMTSKKSKIGAARTIDTTRRAMRHFSSTDQVEGKISGRRSRKTPRRTKSTDSGLRDKNIGSLQGGEKRSTRRGRSTASTDFCFCSRSGSPARMDSSLASLIDIKRQLSSPVRTGSVTSPNVSHSKATSLSPIRPPSPALLLHTQIGSQGSKMRPLSPPPSAPPLTRAKTDESLKYGSKKSSWSPICNKIRSTASLTRTKRGRQRSKAISLASTVCSRSNSDSPPPSQFGRSETAAPLMQKFNNSLGQLASMMPSDGPSIKYIDNSLRAMQQYVHETGTSSDATRVRSPKRGGSAKRNRKQVSPVQNTRLSPQRLPAESKFPMGNSSTSAILSDRTRVIPADNWNTTSSFVDMSASCPALLAKVDTDGSHLPKTEAPSIFDDPLLDASSADLECSEVFIPRMQDNSTLDSSGDRNAAGNDFKSCKDFSLRSLDLNEKPALTTDNSRVSLGLDDLQLIQPTMRAPGTQSFSSGAVGEKRKKAFDEGIPEGFNFSHPVTKRSNGQGSVDWEALGFYTSSERIGQRYQSSKDPFTFSLPKRLMGLTARNDLMSEVVVAAHQRQQSMEARKQKRETSANAQLLLQNLVKQFQGICEAKSCVSEEIVKTAEALLEGDRIGQIRNSARGVFQESMGQLSLDIDQVFDKDDGKYCGKGHSQTASVHHTSSMSLSLRRIFEDSQLGDDEERETKTAESPGTMKAEQLRALFPFQKMKERKFTTSATETEGCKGISKDSLHSGDALGSLATAPVSNLMTSRMTVLSELSDIAEETSNIKGQPETSNLLDSSAVKAVEHESSSPPADDSPPPTPANAATSQPTFLDNFAHQPPAFDFRENSLIPSKANSTKQLKIGNENRSTRGAAEFHLSFPPSLSTQRPLPSATEVGLLSIRNVQCSDDKLDRKIEFSPLSNDVVESVLSPHKMWGGIGKKFMDATPKARNGSQLLKRT